MYISVLTFRFCPYCLLHCASRFIFTKNTTAVHKPLIFCSPTASNLDLIRFSTNIRLRAYGCGVGAAMVRDLRRRPCRHRRSPGEGDVTCVRPHTIMACPGPPLSLWSMPLPMAVRSPPGLKPDPTVPPPSPHFLQSLVWTLFPDCNFF
jgi:hypothetical protein